MLICKSARLSFIFGVSELINTKQINQAIPECVENNRDNHKAIAGSECVVGHMNEMPVSNRSRVFATEKIHGCHVVEQTYLTIQHGDVHVLAIAISISRMQSCKDTHRREHATAEVTHGNARARRGFRVVTCNGHAATNALYHQIKCRPAEIGTTLTKPGNRAGYDARVYC